MCTPPTCPRKAEVESCDQEGLFPAVGSGLARDWAGEGGGDGTAVHMEGTPCLQYQDLALVPDPPISVASDRSINLPEPRFSNYKVFLKGAAGD